MKSQSSAVARTLVWNIYDKTAKIMLTKKVNHQQRQRNRDRQGIDRERIEPETGTERETRRKRDSDYCYWFSEQHWQETIVWGFMDKITQTFSQQAREAITLTAFLLNFFFLKFLFYYFIAPSCYDIIALLLSDMLMLWWDLKLSDNLMCKFVYS